MSFPEVIYQSLTMPVGEEDNEDIQTVLHADRHYRTLKFFYTISDYCSENGAFWYCPKSHVMNEKRLKYELEYSVRSSLERTGKSHTLSADKLEKGRSVISSDLLRDYEIKQMTAPRNTMIIADVSGFHKRGLIEAGNTRKTIRIIYHYVHSPYFVQKIFSLLGKSPGRYLN